MMTLVGWLFIIGGLVSSIFESYAGGTYWTLVGLAFIIAGVGYNIQVEIRKKNP
jgi:membrane protein implicated in regulation of membrane protease activity